VETLEENKDVQPPPARSPDPATAVPPSLSIEDEQVCPRRRGTRCAQTQGFCTVAENFGFCMA